MPPYPIAHVGSTEDTPAHGVAGWGSLGGAVEGSRLVFFVARVRQVVAHLDDPLVRLAPDEEHLYVSQSRQRRIFRMPFYGGGLTEVASPPDEPVDLVVGGGLVVWIGRHWEADPIRGAPYSTQRCVLRCVGCTGGAPRDIAPLGTTAWCLGRDRKNLYWLDADLRRGVQVRTCPLPVLRPGSAAEQDLQAWKPKPAVLASLSSRPSEDTPRLLLAVGQDDTLYWVEPGSRRLMALSTLGGRARPGATRPSVPEALAADATHVFAATPAAAAGRRSILAVHAGSGSVYRLADYAGEPNHRPELGLAGGRLRWAAGHDVRSVSLTAIFGSEPSVVPMGLSDGPGTLGGWLEYTDPDGQLRARGLGMSSPVAVVGRRDGCEVTVPRGAGVSRLHARVRWQEGDLLVEDLGATNGTFLNGLQLLTGRTYPLRDGDRLHCGSFEIVVRMAAQASAVDLGATIPSIPALQRDPAKADTAQNRSISPSNVAQRRLTGPEPEPLASPEVELDPQPNHGEIVTVSRERCPRSGVLREPTSPLALRVDDDEILLHSSLAQGRWVMRWERGLTLDPGGPGQRARCAWLVDAHGRRHPGWLPPTALQGEGMPCPALVDGRWLPVVPGEAGWSVVED